MDIGSKIKELRRLKKVTQEELANAVGISTQAVSKWENGGLPDIELLPSIASYFNVSIDYLFGLPSHEFDNCEYQISKYISTINDKNVKYHEVLNLCWNMQKSIFGYHNVNEYKLDDVMERSEHSQAIQKEGITMMRLSKDGSFFFVAPKPESFYNYLLNSKDKQLKAFKFMSNEDFYNVLIFLNSRENKNFTENLFVRSLDYQKKEVFK